MLEFCIPRVESVGKTQSTRNGKGKDWSSLALRAFVYHVTVTSIQYALRKHRLSSILSILAVRTRLTEKSFKITDGGNSPTLRILILCRQCSSLPFISRHILLTGDLIVNMSGQNCF